MGIKVDDCITGLAPVSLVFTVLDPGPGLTALLGSISRQQILPSEILMVDRGSQDGSLDLLRNWLPPYGSIGKVIEAPGVSESEARNLAIETASFEHIAMTSGTVRLHTDWLAQLWSTLAEGADVAAGVLQPAGMTVLDRAIGAIETRRPPEIDTARYLPPRTGLAFTKTTWDAAGGYPEWLDAGEDLVFAAALRQTGAEFRLAPAAVASWSPPTSLRAYLVESFQVARAAGSAGVITEAPLTQSGGALIGLAVAITVRRPHLARNVALLAGAVRLQGPLRRVLAAPSQLRSSRRLHVAVTVGVLMLSDAAKASGYLTGIADSLRADESRLRCTHTALR